MHHRHQTAGVLIATLVLLIVIVVVLLCVYNAPGSAFATSAPTTLPILREIQEAAPVQAPVTSRANSVIAKPPHRRNGKH